MQSENRILSNQLVVMSREDLEALVNEMAQNIVAAQTNNWNWSTQVKDTRNILPFCK